MWWFKCRLFKSFIVSNVINIPYMRILQLVWWVHAVTTFIVVAWVIHHITNSKSNFKSEEQKDQASFLKGHSSKTWIRPPTILSVLLFETSNTGTVWLTNGNNYTKITALKIFISRYANFKNYKKEPKPSQGRPASTTQYPNANSSNSDISALVWHYLNVYSCQVN